MKKLFTLLLTSLLALTLCACAPGEDNNGVEAGKTIGTIGPLEGDYSVYGLAVKNGVDLAVKDFNEKNGTDYVLKAYDSKGDNTQAVNAFNKLVDEDKVAAVVGATMSGESVAVATASQNTGTPIFSPSATVKAFTLVGDNVFRGCYTDPYQAKIVAEFAYDTLGLRKVAILHENSDYPKGMATTFSEVFTAKGGEILVTEAYNPGDVDFNAQLTKINAVKPDGLFLPNYYKDDALISKQAHAMGLDVQIVGGDGWDGVLNVVEDVKTIEDVVYINHYSPDDEVVKALTDRYKEVYGMDANAFSVLAYDTATCMLEVIEEVGTDSKAIVDALAKKEFDGVLGHMKFDENGDPIKDVAFVTIKDGKCVSFNK